LTREAGCGGTMKKKNTYKVIDIKKGDIVKTGLTLMEAHDYVKKQEVRSYLKIRPEESEDDER
jgi:hypothetical protein